MASSVDAHVQPTVFEDSESCLAKLSGPYVMILSRRKVACLISIARTALRVSGV